MFGVSTNFALANFLAARSFGNVSVALAIECFRRDTSNETYHVPWDFLAMRPSRAMSAAHRPVGRTSGKRSGVFAKLSNEDFAFSPSAGLVPVSPS